MSDRASLRGGAPVTPRAPQELQAVTGAAVWGLGVGRLLPISYDCALGWPSAVWGAGSISKVILVWGVTGNERLSVGGSTRTP